MLRRSLGLVAAGLLAIGVLTAAEPAGPTPPDVTGLRIAPRSVDVTHEPGTVQFDVDVDAVEADVEQVYVSLTDAAGRAFGSGSSVRWAGTPHDGTWRATIRVPQYAAPGDWTTGVTVSASSGYWSFNGGDLEARGLDPVVEVVDETPDAVAPQVSAVALSTTAADVGASSVPVTVSVDIVDQLAGAAWVRLALQRVSGSTEFGTTEWRWADLVEGDRNTGLWTATLILPKNAGDGEWIVLAFLEDMAGNVAHLDRSHMQSAHPDATVTVTGTVEESDNGAPVVDAITIAPSAVNVTDGARRVRVDVTMDDPSGIDWVQLRLRHTTRSLYTDTIRWSGSREFGTWRGYFDIPDYVAPGDYGLEITGRDALGNYRYYSTDELSSADVGPTAVTVANATPDLDPPTLEGFEPGSREIDTTEGPVTMETLLALADARTGVAHARLTWEAVGTYGYGYRYGYGNFLDGDRLSGAWSAEATFGPYDAFGQWDAGIWMYDFAGNETYLNAGDIRGLGLDPSIRVGRRPAAPTDVTAAPAGDLTSVDVAWSAVEESNGQPIVGYRIYRDGELVGEAAGTTFRYRDRGLLPATAYRWTVTAVGLHLDSRPSEPVCGTTDPVTTSIHPGC